MLIMYGGLAGSCWWLMLTVTGFQFIVLKVGSSRVKLLVRPTTPPSLPIGRDSI
jgi:hypothetical protein